MIKVNDNYEIERDPYNWILCELGKGESKKGEPIVTRRKTFHADLNQVAATIIDRDCGRCESLEEIMVLLIDCNRFLTETLETV